LSFFAEVQGKGGSAWLLVVIGAALFILAGWMTVETVVTFFKAGPVSPQE
jgi:hypothetical protein